jgi:uncharacterized protein (TIGR03437 family)
MRSVVIPVFLFSLCAAEAPAQITLNPTPTRVIGQDSTVINNLNPNLVEGREFEFPTSIALDTTTNPPALYVSDTGNNRVLGFRNATSFSNGQPADLVIGQPDLKTTLAAGPSTSQTTGLSSPAGLAVDGTGNLYVVDSANNRILRFPQPLAQPGGTPLPDIVIGQSSFATGGANQGGISAATFSFTTLSVPAGSTSSTTPAEAFITFDSAGNLWVADSGNNRVLRFNASVLGSQAKSGPSADIVLGQVNFISNTYNPPSGSNPLLSTSSFTSPSGIAFDAAGRLFVSESTTTLRGRVLMWTPPFSIGQPAARLLAVDTDNPQPPLVSEFQLNGAPGAVFPIANASAGLTSIGVVDGLNNRVLVFPPVEQWTAGTTYQAAVEVAGQSNFSTGTAFAGQASAGPSGLFRPAAALFYGNELYVADTFDHRVIVMPQNGTSFGAATQVLGQDGLNLNAPNLVEGRELNLSGGDAGVAIDLAANPPHLYVADPGNNRVLCYYDSRNINAGVKADLVLGQPDFQQTQVNYPSNTPTTPNSSGLFNPLGLVVDPAGNLYVADTGNSRVLRFPAPFSNYVPGTPAGTPPPVMEQADLVLGQINFTSTITDTTQRTMAEPYGLALTNFPGLLVSDVALNRVLYFAGTSSSFSSGMPATMVFGQPDFTSKAAGSGSGQLSSPRHVSVDSDDRLYVADAANRRIAIWDHAPTAVLGQPAAQFLTSGLNNPRGIYVNDVNGDIWVGDAGASQAIRYPAFNALEANGYAPNAVINDAGSPRAVAEDAWGNLFLADAVNRVLIYYPGLGAVNAASFLNQSVLAPGMIAALFSQGNAGQFGGQATPAPANVLPLPKQLNGVQVLFNGSPVPLFYADPNQINFEVPMGAPQTGTADVQVVQIAGGRVLGDTTVEMVTADPGIFTLGPLGGIGTAAAINQDGTINGPTNPAIAGQVIQIFGTGQGFVSGAPPDGSAPSGPLQSSRPPTVLIGPEVVTGSGITYAGLAPGEVGVWQVNVTIPRDIITLPTNPTYLVIIQDSNPSGSPATGRAVQIYVKQPS